MKQRFYTTLALNEQDKNRTDALHLKYYQDNKILTYVGIYRRGLDLIEAEEGIKNENGSVKNK